jgi:VanZ family protein
MGKLTSVRWSHVSTCAVLIYWAAMLVGTHLPGSAVPATPYSDKSLHFMAYAGFAFLLAWAWTTRRPFLWGGLLFPVLLTAGYGGLDEFTQTFIPGRYGDVVDWYYNMAGAVTGVGVFFVVEFLGRRVFRWGNQKA